MAIYRYLFLLHVYGSFENRFEGFAEENRSPLHLDNKVERKGKRAKTKKG